jgi:hypothetical protein
MTPGNFIGVAFALLLGLAAAAAQEPIETRGAWRLVADGPDFALRTQARDAPDSTLSLYCRKAGPLYGFEIKSPALASRPSDEETRVGFKVDGDDQVWLTLTSGPNGTVPITHQTAFWIIHEALTRNEAKAVTFTAAGHTWQFALDGLREMTDGLTARCGFAPPRIEPPQRRGPPRR